MIYTSYKFFLDFSFYVYTRLTPSDGVYIQKYSYVIIIKIIKKFPPLNRIIYNKI